MKISESINIRLLTLNNVEDWLKQCEVLDYESGENNIYYGPYNRGEPYSIDKIRKKLSNYGLKKLLFQVGEGLGEFLMKIK